MNRRTLRRLIAPAAGSALLAAAAAAGALAATRPAAAPSLPAGVAASHAALKLLQQHIAAAKSVTYDATVTQQLPGQPALAYQVHGVLARPGIDRITVSQSGQPVVELASTNAAVTAYLPGKSEYLKQAYTAPATSWGSDPAVQEFLTSQGPASAGPAADLSRPDFESPNYIIDNHPFGNLSGKGVETASVQDATYDGRPAISVLQSMTYKSPSGHAVTLRQALVYSKAPWRIDKLSLALGPTPDALKTVLTVAYGRFDLSDAVPDPATVAFAPPATAAPYAVPTTQAADASQQPLAVGQPAPNFTVQTAAGKPVQLADYRGKVVVVDFWATWCGPCQLSLPHTDTIAQKYGKQGVAFLPICVSDTRANFEAWLSEHKSLSMAFLYDPSGTSGASFSSTDYHADAIPTQFVIGKDGKVAAVFVGYDDTGDPSENALQAALDKALAAS